MEFLKEVQEYTANEEQMLAVLAQLEPMLKKRMAMEEAEPALSHIRAFNLDVRLTEKRKKKVEQEHREEKLKRKQAQEEMERLAQAKKARGGPPPPGNITRLDPDSSGQVL